MSKAISTIVYVIIALSICLNTYIFVKPSALYHIHTVDMFVWKFAPVVGGTDIRTLPKNHPYIAEFAGRNKGPLARRIASTELAGRMFRKHAGTQVTIQTIQNCVALWVASWMASFAVVAFFYPKRFMALTMGALAVFWAYLPAHPAGLGVSIYPWDMPAFFFVALGLLIWIRFPKFLPLVLLAGIPFKDTVQTLVILPLIDFVVNRKQGRTLLLCLAAIAIDNASIAWALGFPDGQAVEYKGWCSSKYPDQIRLLWNLEWLFTPNCQSGLLMCSGLLLSSVIVGLTIIKKAYPYLILLGVICSGLMLFGNMQEYRIWLETAPISLIILGLASEKSKEENRVENTVNYENKTFSTSFAFGTDGLHVVSSDLNRTDTALPGNEKLPAESPN